VSNRDKSKPFDVRYKGLRIPFVAAWSDEAHRIDHDATVGRDAVFSGNIDHRQQVEEGTIGKPILGKMAPQRQRYVAVNDLCQVCGRDLVTALAMAHLDVHGPDKLVAFDEPLCCASCALEAMEMCPYVKKQFASQGALLVHKWECRIQLACMRKGDDRTDPKSLADGISRAQFRRYMGKPLAVHVRIVPTKFDRVSDRAEIEYLAALEPGKHEALSKKREEKRTSPRLGLAAAMAMMAAASLPGDRR
jgi:hypothetical protein